MDRHLETAKTAIHDLREAFMHFGAAFERALKELDHAVQQIGHEQKENASD